MAGQRTDQIQLTGNNGISTSILCSISEQSVGVSNQKLGDNCLYTDTLEHSCTAWHLLQLFAPSQTQNQNCLSNSNNNVAMYAGLPSHGELVRTVVASNGPINKDALQFLSKLGRRLVETTGDV